MQRTSATLRLSAQALILAFAALLLVAIGCTGAQASAIPASSTYAAAASAAVSPDAGNATVLNRDSLIEAPLNRGPLNKAPLNNAVLNQTALTQTAATTRPPACTPGRDTARVEKNAVSAPTALLQHSPTGTIARIAAQTGWDADASLLSGRIPDALTHLDLGIVRT